MFQTKLVGDWTFFFPFPLKSPTKFSLSFTLSSLVWKANLKNKNKSKNPPKILKKHGKLHNLSSGLNNLLNQIILFFFLIYFSSQAILPHTVYTSVSTLIQNTIWKWKILRTYDIRSGIIKLLNLLYLYKPVSELASVLATMLTFLHHRPHEQ